MTVVANRIATAATHNDANGGNGTTTAVPSRARRDEETTRTESNHHGAEHRGSWSREQSAFSSRHEVTLDTSVTALPAPQPVQDDRVHLVRSIMIATRAVTQDEVDRIDTRSNRACGAATTMIRMRNRGTAAVVKHLMTVVGRGLFSTTRVTALAEQICTAATPRWTQDQVQEIARLFPTGTDGKMWMYITALQKYTAQHSYYTCPAMEQAQLSNPAPSLALPMHSPQQPNPRRTPRLIDPTATPDVGLNLQHIPRVPGPRRQDSQLVPPLALMVQDTGQLDSQQALRYQIVKTRMEALTVITATFKYHDDPNPNPNPDPNADHVDAAYAARAAFMKRAGPVKRAQYAAYKYKNQYQLITTRSRREGGEENCAMMAMEASLNGMSPDAFREEYLSTVSQDSTVWRMATMLAGTGCSDMVFLVTSEGGRRSIMEIEGKGCLDRITGILLFT